jgi:pimeloyl-ACP methyl ester carboxylesterase
MRTLKLFSKVQKIALLLAILSFSGCNQQKTTVPIETIRYTYSGATKARMLLVFLPGRGDSLKTFEKNGIVEAVRERGLPADMIAVNAHLGYYLKGSFFPRMKEDVIEPAKARAYEQIWMIGDSLGGFGSLSYAREYPDDITGVVLLGPFLGEELLIREIKKAGFERWQPGGIVKSSQGRQERMNWIWLIDQVRLKAGKHGGNKHDRVPAVYLGYGRNDRFVSGHDLLASLLQPEHVISIEGEHDWSTWKKIWISFLDKKIFETKNDK